MEPVSLLLQRPIPRLKQSRGTTNVSISGEAILAQFLHEWLDFPQQVSTLCNSLNIDANANVSVTDDSDDNEHFLVGSKLGLAGRFYKHVCDAVAKALSVTDLAHLAFGDFQATHTDSGVPDVVLLTLPRMNVLAGGVLKPFWMVELEEYPVSDGPANMSIMQPHFGILNPTETLAHLLMYLGQLVSYMRANRLKYGFLSTYRSTVFVRRTGDFRFELSLPIDEQATRPSLRQCFLAFCLLATQDGRYTEPPDFNPARVSA